MNVKDLLKTDGGKEVIKRILGDNPQLMEAIGKIEMSDIPKAIENLYCWQHRGSTSFTSQLFELFGKADHINKQKLFVAFPAESIAWSSWYMSDDPDDFFKQHGFGAGH